jgi:hypothetical protein
MFLHVFQGIKRQIETLVSDNVGMSPGEKQSLILLCENALPRLAILVRDEMKKDSSINIHLLLDAVSSAFSQSKTTPT